MEPYRIIIADDHGMIRQGIKSFLCQYSAFEVIAEASDGEELLECLKFQTPDMVILDISMPRLNGIEALSLIREAYPLVRVLLLTMHSNAQYFYHALSAGAHGYLLKDESDTELIRAIKEIQQGKVYVSPKLVDEVTGDMALAFRKKKKIPIVHLTDREKQVLQLVVKGHTSKQMAGMLCLSPRTIDHYRANLLRKFEMKNTVDLVNHVISNAIIVPE